jgi:hypothetical protein
LPAILAQETNGLPRNTRIKCIAPFPSCVRATKTDHYPCAPISTRRDVKG